MSMLRFSTTLLAFAALANAGILQAQQTQTQTKPARPNQPSSQSPASNDGVREGGVSVEQALVKKLQKANQAEIELATMAQQKVDSPELQQLTKAIIQDHKACNAKLQKLDSSQSSATARSSQTDPTPAFKLVGNSEATTQNGQRQVEGNQSQENLVPRQLCLIMEQACDNSLQMTKEMLQEYEGRDFQMAFLGQQCVAHTTMLAELRAIESSGPQALRAFASEAATKIEKHLEMVKQLAKKLGDDVSTNG